MDLIDLGLEYLKQAEILRQRARDLSLQMNDPCGSDYRDIKRRQASLYSDALECCRIAKILLSYYRKEWLNEPHELQP